MMNTYGVRVVLFSECAAPHECTEEELAKLAVHHPDVLEAFPSEDLGAYREWFNADPTEAGGIVYARLDESLSHIQVSFRLAVPPPSGYRR